MRCFLVALIPFRSKLPNACFLVRVSSPIPFWQYGMVWYGDASCQMLMFLVRVTVSLIPFPAVVYVFNDLEIGLQDKRESGFDWI